MHECRICYENENENKNKLIYPCACKGTQKYVHAECLEKWRRKKRNKIEYLQCQECKKFYNIGNKYSREIAKFNLDLPVSYKELFSTLSINIPIIIFSSVLCPADSTFTIPEDMSIGDTTILITLLKKNSMVAYCYYYSFSIFVITAFIYVYIFFWIQWYIRYKIRYWKHAIFPYLFSMLFSFHYYYLYLFTIADYVEIYIYGTTLLSVYNILFALFFFNSHDEIIEKLNTTDNKDYIHNYKEAERRSQENVIVSV